MRKLLQTNIILVCLFGLLMFITYKMVNNTSDTFGMGGVRYLTNYPKMCPKYSMHTRYPGYLAGQPNYKKKNSIILKKWQYNEEKHTLSKFIPKRILPWCRQKCTLNHMCSSFATRNETEYDESHKLKESIGTRTCVLYGQKKKMSDADFKIKNISIKKKNVPHMWTLYERCNEQF